MPSPDYEIMFGHKPGEPVPGEIRIFNRVSLSLTQAAKSYGPSVVRQVVSVAARRGLQDHLGYVFFALMENRRGWPPMPPYMHKALMFGRWLIILSASVPDYSKGMAIPPDLWEDEVDKALLDVAKWCYTDLRKDLGTDYIRVLKASFGGYERTRPEASLAHFKGAFEEQVYDTPLSVTDGPDANRIVRFIAI